jgi:DNA-binding response OmpR family regulator
VELEGKLLTRVFADRGFFDVVHARDAATALKHVDESVPCVVIADVELGNGSGVDLIRQIRARVGAPYVYTIVLTGKGSPERMREAFDAGADDYALKPFRAEELVARVRVAQRIVGLERSLHARAKELESTLRALDAVAAQQALARVMERENPRAQNAIEALLVAASWDRLSATLMSAFAAYSGTELAVAATGDTAAAIVGEVFMTDPERQLEIGVAVVMSGAATSSLAMAMLGESDIESGCALVLEGANVLVGAVKLVMAESGYDFAVGLPTQANLSDCRAAYDAHPVRQRFAFESSAFHVDVWLRISERRNTRLRGDKLREGMIIAEDVHDERGRLLIRGGVRLTQTTAERLAQLLARVEVSVSS